LGLERPSSIWGEISFKEDKDEKATLSDTPGDDLGAKALCESEIEGLDSLGAIPAPKEDTLL